MKYGLMLSTDGIAASLLPELARNLEASELDSIWVPELFGRDPFVVAGRLLSLTNDIRVNTGIANVYSRDAMAIKAGAITLAELYGNRFSLGIGVSNKMGNEARGHEWVSPVSKLEAFFAGYDSAPMMIKPEVDIPLYLAAHGPKLLNVAAQHADGALSYLGTGAYHREAKSQLGDKELIVIQPVAFADSASAGRKLARRALRIYMPLPNYQRAWQAQGFSAQDTAAEGSDEFVDALIPWGDAGAIAERFAQHRENGVDRVVLTLLNTDAAGCPDMKLLTRLLAEAP